MVPRARFDVCEPPLERLRNAPRPDHIAARPKTRVARAGNVNRRAVDRAAVADGRPLADGRTLADCGGLVRPAAADLPPLVRRFRQRRV